MSQRKESFQFERSSVVDRFRRTEKQRSPLSRRRERTKTIAVTPERAEVVEIGSLRMKSLMRLSFLSCEREHTVFDPDGKFCPMTLSDRTLSKEKSLFLYARSLSNREMAVCRRPSRHAVISLLRVRRLPQKFFLLPTLAAFSAPEKRNDNELLSFRGRVD